MIDLIKAVLILTGHSIQCTFGYHVWEWSVLDHPGHNHASPPESCLCTYCDIPYGRDKDGK